MRIEKTDVQKVYSFKIEIDTNELWEIYKILIDHPYVEAAENLVEIMKRNVPEMKKYENYEKEELEV